MDMHAVKNKLLIQIIEQEPEKKSVLIMPNEKKDILRACILSVGEDATIPVRVGDHILVSPYCGQRIPQDDSTKEVRTIVEGDVLVRFGNE